MRMPGMDRVRLYYPVMSRDSSKLSHARTRPVQTSNDACLLQPKPSLARLGRSTRYVSYFAGVVLGFWQSPGFTRRLLHLGLAPGILKCG